MPKLCLKQAMRFKIENFNWSNALGVSIYTASTVPQVTFIVYCLYAPTVPKSFQFYASKSTLPQLCLIRLVIFILKPKHWLLLLHDRGETSVGKLALKSCDIWKSPGCLPGACFALGRLHRFRVWQIRHESAAGSSFKLCLATPAFQSCKWTSLDEPGPIVM